MRGLAIFIAVLASWSAYANFNWEAVFVIIGAIIFLSLEKRK
jgi:hypothetical protein